MSLSWAPPKGRLGEPHLPTGSRRPLGLSAGSRMLSAVLLHSGRQQRRGSGRAENPLGIGKMEIKTEGF